MSIRLEAEARVSAENPFGIEVGAVDGTISAKFTLHVSEKPADYDFRFAGQRTPPITWVEISRQEKSNPELADSICHALEKFQKTQPDGKFGWKDYYISDAVKHLAHLPDPDSVGEEGGSSSLRGIPR